MANERKIITGFAGKQPNVILEKIPEKNSAETDLLDKIMASLRQDATSYEDFERKLIKELRDVKDMENNIIHIQAQIEVMKRLLNTREDIARRIIYENQKGMDDIDHFQTLFSNFSKISSELKSDISLAMIELEKLFLTQTHTFYLENQNRTKMNEISDDAKKLNTELIVISRHFSSLEIELERIYNEFLKKRQNKQ
jgi:hypothetical protein